MRLPDIYSALADPTRLRVLEMLHAGAKPVHALAAAFDISRPAISRHLRVLKEAGLVKEEKQGRENVYAFQRTALKSAAAWLDKHRASPAAASKPQSKPARPAAVKPSPAPAEARPVAAKAKPVAAKPKAVAKPAPAAAAAAPQLSFFDL